MMTLLDKPIIHLIGRAHNDLIRQALSHHIGWTYADFFGLAHDDLINQAHNDLFGQVHAYY